MIAGQIGVLVYIGALVMVAENDGAVAELCSCGANALVAGFILQSVKKIKFDAYGVHLQVSSHC